MEPAHFGPRVNDQSHDPLEGASFVEPPGGKAEGYEQRTNLRSSACSGSPLAGRFRNSFSSSPSAP